MSKIARYTGNLRAFGSNAQGLERTLFGETTQADDLTSQVTAAFLRGWGVVGPSENPSLEDFNAAFYAISQFIAYQHQMGVPEWDAAQEYYVGSLCVRAGETYASVATNNIGSAPPSAKWTQVITVKNASSSLSPRYVKLTASGSFTVPDGVTKLYVSGCAGGGGGGGGAARNSTGSAAAGGGGGGGGQSVIKNTFSVTPGQVINVVIGSGGAAGAGSTAGNSGGVGGNGGSTIFGSLLTLNGGSAGGPGTYSTTTSPGGTGGAGYPAGGSSSSVFPTSTGGYGIAGLGGSTAYGGGGAGGICAGASTTSGGDSYGYGSGGGGGGGNNVDTSGSGKTGGVGSPGLIIVEW